jgi:hypothetical protein
VRLLRRIQYLRVCGCQPQLLALACK